MIRDLFVIDNNVKVIPLPCSFRVLPGPSKLTSHLYRLLNIEESSNRLCLCKDFG